MDDLTEAGVFKYVQTSRVDVLQSEVASFILRFTPERMGAPAVDSHGFEQRSMGTDRT